MWLFSAGFLVGWFLLLVVAERLFPRQDRSQHTRVRMANNVGLGLLNTVILRFGVPVSVIGVAAWASQQGLGLWNILDFGGPLEILTSFVVLDLAVWLQHVLSHRLAWFWRLHRVHHLDVEFDVTTAVRFHPLEILVSLVYKCAVGKQRQQQSGHRYHDIRNGIIQQIEYGLFFKKNKHRQALIKKGSTRKRVG